VGWLFVWSTSGWQVILSGMVVLVSGVAVYSGWRAWANTRRPVEASL